ncbi:hypothetical protein THAOC_27063, partial [Thalassiosira oceanica]
LANDVVEVCRGVARPDAPVVHGPAPRRGGRGVLVPRHDGRPVDREEDQVADAAQVQRALDAGVLVAVPPSAYCDRKAVVFVRTVRSDEPPREWDGWLAVGAVPPPRRRRARPPGGGTGGPTPPGPPRPRTG